MRKPTEKPKIKLVGVNGNAYNILGIAKEALMNADADSEYVDQYLEEAMSGDYDHLLQVTMEYADII